MIDELAERSADPARVRTALDRLPHPRDDLEAVAEPLVAVLAASRSLAACSRRTPRRSRARPERRASIRRAVLDDLVAWKRRELLRIAARDLVGADSLEVTTAALAALARTSCGSWPTRPTMRSAPDDRLAIIGMGKLGGNELNYASDVDVLLVGEGDTERLERGAGRARAGWPRLSRRCRPAARRP